MKKCKITVDGDTRLVFSGDFAQASSPLLINGESTPFQVADARHRVTEAARILLGYCESSGGPVVGEDEEWEVEEVVTVGQALARVDDDEE